MARDEVEYELFEEHEDSDVNEEFDPNNPDPNQVNFMKWQSDFYAENKEVPKGSYVGQYFAPSQFEFDYKPEWNKRRTSERDDDVLGGESGYDLVSQDVGNFGITIISETLTFSRSEIMNGASEFWVRLPVLYEDLEVLSLSRSDEIVRTSAETDALLHERKAERKTDIHSAVYMFEGKHNNFEIDGDTTSGMFDLRGDDDEYSQANYMITERNNYNNSVYQKMNVIVEPEIEYTFAFIMITRDKPMILLDEVIGMNPQVTLKDIEVLGASDIIRDDFRYIHHVDMETDKDYSEDLFASPHFSFVFSRGIGRNNLFGKSLNEDSHVMISTSSDDVSEGYPSIYMPFKYDDLDKGLRPEISLSLADDEQNVLRNIDESSSYYSLYDWDAMEGFDEYGLDYGFEFDRFLLYSGEEYNHAQSRDDDDIYIDEVKALHMYGNLPQNFTFLCKPRDDFTYEKRAFPSREAPPSGSDSDRNKNIVINNNWLGEVWRTYDTDKDFYDINSRGLVDRTDETRVNELGINYTYTEVTYNFDFEQIKDRYFYEPHSSFEFTDGRWNTIKLSPQVEYIDAREAVERGMTEGTIINTRHRDYIIRLKGDVTYYQDELDDYRNSLRYKIRQIGEDPWDNPLEVIAVTARHIVDRISYYVQEGINYMRRGIDRLWGTITSFGRAMWEAMNDLGSWIHRNIMRIVDVITRVAGQLYELAYMQIQAFQYIFGVLGLVLATYLIIGFTESKFKDGSDIH